MATLPDNDITVCVKPQGRPCWVYEVTPGGTRIPGKPKKKALLHVITTKAFVIDASPLRGGHPGGQISRPVAVVEYEDGNLDEVDVHQVQLLDTRAEMHEQAGAWGLDELPDGSVNCATCKWRKSAKCTVGVPCNNYSRWEHKGE